MWLLYLYSLPDEFSTGWLKLDRIPSSYETFSRCSHGTDKPRWIELFSTFPSCFTICQSTERYLSKSKMASPSWVARHSCNHAFAVQKFRRIRVFTPRRFKFRPYRLKSDLDFGVDNFWTVRRLIKFSYSPNGSVSTQQLNARIYNRSEIRPVPCECSLIFVHTDKTLVSNTMNGFFSQKDQPARISAFKWHEQSKRT